MDDFDLMSPPEMHVREVLGIVNSYNDVSGIMRKNMTERCMALLEHLVINEGYTLCKKNSNARTSLGSRGRAKTRRSTSLSPKTRRSRSRSPQRTKVKKHTVRKKRN